MPLLIIENQPTTKQAFIASENVSHLAVVEISPAGPGYCRLGTELSAQGVGVAWGANSGLSSGKVVQVVTTGSIVSGVICASSINAGDRLAVASGGRVTPLNSMNMSARVVANLLSGAGGTVHVDSSALSYSSGIISGVGGFMFTSGTTYNTGRLFGKALTSGATNAGIMVFVMPGG
jgi:hypothetical protein